MKSSITLVLILFTLSCKTAEVPSGITACIQSKIDTFKSLPVQNPPASVWQYTYKGNTVYYIAAPCCDKYSTLYDKDCTKLCSPDGGITGKGDNKCTDFNTTKTNERLIWKDARH